jgi:hypothetical protein
MFKNNFPISVLGQSTLNPKSAKPNAAPDTNTRFIKLRGSGVISPDFLYDHTFLEYISPVGDTSLVNFEKPINAEDRSLHWLVLDNSNNSGSKTFTFSKDYVFLDNISANTYSVDGGKKQIWYGTYSSGKLQLRVASESTN